MNPPSQNVEETIRVGLHKYLARYNCGNCKRESIARMHELKLIASPVTLSEKVYIKCTSCGRTTLLKRAK